MNRLIKILNLILFSILHFGFDTPDIITEIKKKYAAINDSIDKYDKETNNDINVYKDLNPNNYSFESTNIYRLATIHLDRFYDNGKLRKAVVQFSGDREVLISEYYFWDDKLFFCI